MGVNFTMKLYHSEMVNQKIMAFSCRDAQVSEHEHSFLELAYIRQGSALHHINGRCFSLRAGDWFLIDYGQKHSYRQTGDTPLVVINCLFLPQFVSEIFKNNQSLVQLLGRYALNLNFSSPLTFPAEFCFHDSDGSVGFLVERLLAEYENHAGGYLEMMRTLLSQLLILAMRQLHRCELPHTVSGDMVQYITDYVQKNFSQKLSLEKIVAAYPYSLGFVSRRFKEEIGVPFQTYVQNVRIRESCRLLAETPCTVTEIAAAVGYTDIKFFGRLFKQQTGVTPRTYRLAHTRP